MANAKLEEAVADSAAETSPPEQLEKLKERFKSEIAKREKRNSEELKKSLDAPSDEFAVIKSKIDTLQNLKRQAQPVRSSRRGGRGGQDFRQMFERIQKGDQTHSKKIKAASNALSSVMKNKSASTQQIQSKLSALRNAKKTLNKAIQAAKENLQAILTTKQEATLVLRNILD